MSEPFDLDALMQQALAMQQQVLDAQERAADTEVEGSAGGGSVTVTMTGAGEVRAVRIAPEVVDPEDVELLEDLVLAAFRDAGQRVAELQAKALGGMSGLAQLGGLADLGGLTGAIGGLTGAPGGPGPDALAGPGSLDAPSREEPPDNP